MATVSNELPQYPQHYISVERTSSQQMAYPNKEYFVDFEMVKSSYLDYEPHTVGAPVRQEMYYDDASKVIVLNPSVTTNKRVYKLSLSLLPDANEVKNGYAITTAFCEMKISTGIRTWLPGWVKKKIEWWCPTTIGQVCKAEYRYENYGNAPITTLYECTLTGDDMPVALSVAMVVNQKGDKKSGFRTQHISQVSFTVIEIYRH